jgi:hypothetical protein
MSPCFHFPPGARFSFFGSAAFVAGSAAVQVKMDPARAAAEMRMREWGCVMTV